MKNVILKALLFSTMTMGSSYAAQTILDCHIEGVGSHSLHVETDLASATIISGRRMFSNQKAQLVTSRFKRFLDVTVNRYPHKNTCMTYTYFTAEEFLVKNDPCGNTRVFEGEFQGDKVICVMNSLIN